jgi:hypothetical protein
MLAPACRHNPSHSEGSQHGKEFRTIMPIASRETKGRADGRRVQEIVRELTS